jgi:predicted metal-dependent HD superfamily phosphohydrolase
MMNYFRKSWDRIWRGIGGLGESHDLMAQILERYSESHRHYHTLQHLKECLVLAEKFSDLSENPFIVEISLWFHDAIYDVKLHDNEERSAAFAETELKKRGIAPEIIRRVSQLILITRHSAQPETLDEEILSDIDLAILGANESRFLQYEQQVRREYDWVPENVYRVKRKEILEGFLNRDYIYNTPRFGNCYEDKARGNLLASILKLKISSGS